MCQTKTSTLQQPSSPSTTPATNWKSQYDPTTSKMSIPSKKEIKAAIPKECFEISTLHSLSYVVRDTIWAVAAFAAAYYFLSSEFPSTFLSVEGIKFVVGWSLYGFWQGTILTGHWVLAHEAGHGAFSPSPLINDIVGFILHQLLLVPYFAWKYSHAKHHRRTNHLTEGESHVPSTAAEQGINMETLEKEAAYAWMHDMMGDGIFAGFQVFTHLVIGWPIYLLGLASTGRLSHDGKPLSGIADHFRPYSEMFPQKIQYKILASTVGVLAGFAYLAYLSFFVYTPLTVTLYYGIPYMVTNAWLVLYTWLQHTDASVPQYGPDVWTWEKGALSTIDRDYGIFDYFHHQIGSTHVAHHLFHEMPFYKADVATAALKAKLEPLGLYNFDPQPWYWAMFKVANECHYVENTEGVQYYKSLNDLKPNGKGKKGIKFE